MDIECYNSFMFFGNKKVGQKIEAWKAKIESLQGKSKDPLGLLIVRDVFNPKKHAQDSISYGCGWIYPANDMQGSDRALFFVTDGTPPDGLQMHITSILSEIDPNVVVRNRYTLNTGSEGFVYMTVTDQKVIHTEKVYVDLDEFYKQYDSGIEAEAASEAQLKEFEIEAVYDMMSDVPGSEKTFKKYVKDVDIDWNFIEERKTWDF